MVRLYEYSHSIPIRMAAFDYDGLSKKICTQPKKKLVDPCGSAVERQSLESGQRSFAVLRSTCSRRVTTYVG